MLKFMLAAQTQAGHDPGAVLLRVGHHPCVADAADPLGDGQFPPLRAALLHQRGRRRHAHLSRCRRMNWDNMADHVVDDYEAIGLPFKDQDYPNRMQPHKFGDDNFAVELLDWETLYEEEGFYAGGVKLIHWLRKRPELSHEEFNAKWREHGSEDGGGRPERADPQAGHRQARAHGPGRLQGHAVRVRQRGPLRRRRGDLVPQRRRPGRATPRPRAPQGAARQLRGLRRPTTTPSRW